MRLVTWLPSRRLQLLIALVVIAMGWWAWRGYAQVPKAYIVRVYTVGGGTEYQTFTFPTAHALCDVQPYIGALPIVDPNKLEWSDPDHPGKVCVWQGLNHTLPIPGSYEVTLAVVNRAGETSTESARAPFTITQTPDLDVPVGVKVYR